MKPNTKSGYFTFSLAAFGLYFALLLFLRSYALHVVTHGGQKGNLILIVTWVSVALVAAGVLCWYKSAHPHASRRTQIAVFVLSPIVLSPVLGLLQVLIVLLPIYDLAGRTVIR